MKILKEQADARKKHKLIIDYKLKKSTQRK